LKVHSHTAVGIAFDASNEELDYNVTRAIIDSGHADGIFDMYACFS